MNYYSISSAAFGLRGWFLHGGQQCMVAAVERGIEVVMTALQARHARIIVAQYIRQYKTGRSEQGHRLDLCVPDDTPNIIAVLPHQVRHGRFKMI